MMGGKRFLKDLDRDIHDHIEHETRDNIERGMSPEEARQAAVRKFGNITLVKEDARAVWIPVWIEQLLQDTRYGARMLRRNPGFTAVVILTLALGIGMNTAVFSVFNAVLLRPLVYPDQDRLLYLSMKGRRIAFGMEVVARTDFVDWREQATSFERMVATEHGYATISNSDDGTRARLVAVSDDFWGLSGARAALGRLPQPGERHALLISHEFFERWFHSDPRMVGSAVTIDGKQQVIITGVLPKGFPFQLPPSFWPGFDNSKAVDGYSPMIISPQDRVRSAAYAGMVTVVAKLKPGVTADRAQAEIEAIRGRVRQASPKWFTNDAKLRIMPLRDLLVGEARKALWVLLGAVVFVLLIACANIASLLLARASARQKEIAIRASLGAGRGRVLRQFLVESTLLALMGGLGGLLLARWGLALVLRLIPGAVPRLAEATVDGRGLAFALGASILTAFLFGVGPAISLWTANLHTALKEGVKASSAGSGSLRTRSALVAVELALAMVLLSGAGLMVKSFWRMNGRPPGFDPEHILVVKAGAHSRDVLRERAYATEILHGMQSVPGVQAVSFTTPDARISLNWEGVTFPGEGPPPQAVFNVTSAALPRVMGCVS
jgi:predicted permease